MKQFPAIFFLNLFIICFFTSCDDNDKIIQSNSYPPNVTIAYPLDGSTVSEIVTITCMATGSDPIKKVSLWVDGLSLPDAIDTDEPFELQWNTVGYEDATKHTIIARALDETGNQMDSAPIKLIVDNSTSRPIQIELGLIHYVNNTFQIKWQMSKDDDFKSYILYQSLSADLSDEAVIYTSSTSTDTSYVVNGVSQGEYRYYRLVIEDTLGLQSSSSIQTAGAFEVLFSDEFSGDLSQWEIITGTWNTYNGKLMGQGHGGNIDAWIYAGNESWTDYEISFTVYFETGNAEVILRSTGHWQDEYRVHIWPEDYGSTGDPYANTYGFIYYKNGQQYSSIEEHRLCPVPITNPANIRVSIIGNKISLYINSTFVDSIIDLEPLPSGRFGLGVIWSLESSFDNVVVRKL